MGLPCPLKPSVDYAYPGEAEESSAIGHRLWEFLRHDPERQEQQSYNSLIMTPKVQEPTLVLNRLQIHPRCHWVGCMDKYLHPPCR